MEVKINLGCGGHTPLGWINVDYAIGAKLAKIPLLSSFGLTRLKWNKSIVIHNLLKSFPWETESVDVIYSSHTLEHFTREDGYRFLKECHRVLKQGGIIRIVIPDLKASINSYLEGKTRSDYFVENLMVLYPNAKNMVKKVLLPLISFPHKCMYDTETLLNILNEIGFEAKSQKGLESSIVGINDIEILSRTLNSVVVEGKKSIPFNLGQMQKLK